VNSQPTVCCKCRSQSAMPVSVWLFSPGKTHFAGHRRPRFWESEWSFGACSTWAKRFSRRRDPSSPCGSCSVSSKGEFESRSTLASHRHLTTPSTSQRGRSRHLPAHGHVVVRIICVRSRRMTPTDDVHTNSKKEEQPLITTIWQGTFGLASE
jgi:hypothetical protein